MSTTVILFSKDRPWQASEYIRTYNKYNKDTTTNIIVLWYSERYEEQYNKVISNSPSNVKWIKQNDHDTFGKDLESILYSIATDHILFGVDDVIWYGVFDTRNAESVLKLPAFAYSFRLHDKITYCQPARQNNIVPTLLPIDGNLGYFYSRNIRGIDWDYPLEVSATMMNSNFVISLWNNVVAKFGYPKSPNFLEDWFQKFRYPHSSNSQACIGTSVCSTITINRVQHSYQNELYSCEYDLDTINGWIGIKQFDDEKYALQSYNSIHIGDLFVKEIKS